MEFVRMFSGPPSESQFGYCRAIEAGGHIFVSGTAAVDGQGNVVAAGDAYGQARYCFGKIQWALQELGADCGDVVRTRMFVTDIARWTECAQVQREFFGDAPPTTTLAEVTGLNQPEMMIGVEADAFAPVGRRWRRMRACLRFPYVLCCRELDDIEGACLRGGP